jgi:hypothetical protein
VLEHPDGATIGEPSTPLGPPDDVGPPPCPPAPIAECNEATKSSILLSQGKSDDKEKLVWSWKGGEATVETADGTTLCLYDGTGKLLVSELAPSTGRCKDQDCWQEKGKKTRYWDPNTRRTGVREVVVRDGTKTKLLVRGKGLRLGLPETPIDPLPLTVQLIDGTGGCWGTSYGSAKKNDEKTLKAGG